MYKQIPGSVQGKARWDSEQSGLAIKIPSKPNHFMILWNRSNLNLFELKTDQGGGIWQKASSLEVGSPGYLQHHLLPNQEPLHIKSNSLVKLQFTPFQHRYPPSGFGTSPDSIPKKCWKLKIKIQFLPSPPTLTSHILPTWHHCCCYELWSLLLPQESCRRKLIASWGKNHLLLLLSVLLGEAMQPMEEEYLPGHESPDADWDSPSHCIYCNSVPAHKIWFTWVYFTCTGMLND